MFSARISRNQNTPLYVMLKRSWNTLKFYPPIQNCQIEPYSYKLTNPLFLTSAGRCHEICYLDIRYMVKTFSSYKFHFSKLTKSWKKRKAPPCLELRPYPQDRDSCVMTCLDMPYRAEILSNKIEKLHKAAKRPECNSDFMS